ncbi:hypothetical protein ABGB18_05305 [Nonomuraea sp. B12E4]|uniref:hypothetical protein n=1 Tax=Nonomuraea sp. B12E4 TaxID=3153564 RepID=UPI00325F7661
MRCPVRAGVVVLAATVLVACAGTGGDPEPSATPRAERPAEVLDLVGDPNAPAPLAFEPEAAHVIPTGRVDFPTITLNGRAAWFSHASGVTVYDLATGRPVTEIRVQNTPTYEVPAPGELTRKQAGLLRDRVTEPEPVRVGGVPAMFTVVPVQIGQDGGAAQAGFEVIVARADNGKVIWRLPVDIYGDPAGELGALLVSADADKVAVTWTEDGAPRGAFAVALDEPRVLWQRPGFWLVDGHDEALLGFRVEPDQTYSLAGVGIADGRDLWHKKVPAGVTWATKETGGPLAELEDDSKQARLIEIATGDFALSKDDGLTKRMYCGHGAGGSVVLCASKQDGMIAVSDTGEILWRRAAGDGPDWKAEVEAVFRDVAYAVGEGGTFVLDARTGRKLGGDPGVVPDRVGAHAALVFTGAGTEVHLPRR